MQSSLGRFEIPPKPYLGECWANATIAIENATSFTSEIKLVGQRWALLTGGTGIVNMFPERSTALLCERIGEGEKPKRNRRRRMFEFGKRSSNDFLIQFRRIQATYRRRGWKRNYPIKRLFFEEPNIAITYVKVKTNVRKLHAIVVII